jgi:hypothetical protein
MELSSAILIHAPAHGYFTEGLEARGSLFANNRAPSVYTRIHAGFGWDVAPDGKRFLIDTATTSTEPVTVLLNWTEK